MCAADMHGHLQWVAECAQQICMGIYNEQLNGRAADLYGHLQWVAECAQQMCMGIYNG